MKVTVSSTRQAHYKMPVNWFVNRGDAVTFITSTPETRMRGFVPNIRHRFVPAPVSLLSGAFRVSMPTWADELDTTLYDWQAARALNPCDLTWSGASGSLAFMKAAKRQGSLSILDRACPHIQVQQDFLALEAEIAGGKFTRSSRWFIDRQIEEYEIADFIVCPSNYSKKSFPENLQRKICIVPLFGRLNLGEVANKPSSGTFTVGVVGGNPLRKGYLYLFEAWKKLALPNAKLLIRSDPSLGHYPRLVELAASIDNLEFVPYVPDIADFYSRCDVFVLPSIDDGFGMALFEAVGSGVAAIATTNTGATELLKAGEDLLVVEPRSVVQIQEALLHLYRNPELREAIATTGRKSLASIDINGEASPYSRGMEALMSAAQKGSTLYP